MHVVRVRHLFYPDMPKDYFYELSVRQVMKGYDVDVITWAKNGKSCVKRVSEGFFIRRLHGLNFSLGDAVQEYPYLPNLSREVELLKPDVVHAESHLFLPSFQAIKKARRLGLPCVVSVHGVFADRGFGVNFAQRLYLRSLGLSVFKSANRVICLTLSDAKEVVRLGCPSEKVRLVPNAVDTELFKPCKECEEDNLVVWVGRFVPEKGLNYLIEAAKIIVDDFKFKNVRFLLVGYGPWKKKIMKLAYDYRLAGKFIRFTEALGRDEVAKVLGKATIFVFPSLREGLPLSVLEAMACGVPVVGSDVPGINDVIVNGKNGLLVPARDPKALAKAVLTLLNDEDLGRELGQNDRKLVMEKYNWDVVVNEIEKVYHEAIKEVWQQRNIKLS